MRALALAALLAACGGKNPPSSLAVDEVPEPPIPRSPAGIDRAVIEEEAQVLEEIAVKMCACKDLACIEAVDLELVAAARTATMNDALTDLETWPADLDARGRRATQRMLMCAIQYGYTTRASGIHVLRKTTQLREYVCACEDVSCTRRVQARLVEYLNENTQANLDEPTTAAFTEEMAKARRCIEASFAGLAQQALLDMRAIRRQACECADSECAAAVTRRIEQWAQGMQGVAADETTTQEFEDLSAEVRACLETARGRQ